MRWREEERRFRDTLDRGLEILEGEYAQNEADRTGVGPAHVSLCRIYGFRR